MIPIDAQKLDKAIVEDRYQMPSKKHLIDIFAEQLDKRKRPAVIQQALNTFRTTFMRKINVRVVQLQKLCRRSLRRESFQHKVQWVNYNSNRT